MEGVGGLFGTTLYLARQIQHLEHNSCTSNSNLWEYNFFVTPLRNSRCSGEGGRRGWGGNFSLSPGAATALLRTCCRFFFVLCCRLQRLIDVKPEEDASVGPFFLLNIIVVLVGVQRKILGVLAPLGMNTTFEGGTTLSSPAYDHGSKSFGKAPSDSLDLEKRGHQPLTTSSGSRVAPPPAAGRATADIPERHMGDSTTDNTWTQSFFPNESSLEPELSINDSLFQYAGKHVRTTNQTGSMTSAMNSRMDASGRIVPEETTSTADVDGMKQGGDEGGEHDPSTRRMTVAEVLSRKARRVMRKSFPGGKMDSSFYIIASVPEFASFLVRVLTQRDPKTTAETERRLELAKVGLYLCIVVFLYISGTPQMRWVPRLMISRRSP